MLTFPCTKSKFWKTTMSNSPATALSRIQCISSFYKRCCMDINSIRWNRTHCIVRTWSMGCRSCTRACGRVQLKRIMTNRRNAVAKRVSRNHLNTIRSDLNRYPCWSLIHLGETWKQNNPTPLARKSRSKKHSYCNSMMSLSRRVVNRWVIHRRIRHSCLSLKRLSQ